MKGVSVDWVGCPRGKPKRFSDGPTVSDAPRSQKSACLPEGAIVILVDGKVSGFYTHRGADG